MTKIKILPSSNGQWYYTRVARNGKTKYNSETYTRKSTCRREAKKHSEELKGAVKIEEA